MIRERAAISSCFCEERGPGVSLLLPLPAGPAPVRIFVQVVRCSEVRSSSARFCPLAANRIQVLIQSLLSPVGTGVAIVLCGGLLKDFPDLRCLFRCEVQLLALGENCLGALSLLLGL